MSRVYKKLSSAGEDDMIVMNDRRDDSTSDRKLNMGMSYIRCGRCNDDKLMTCNCEYPNYYCKCGWSHINHRHGDEANMNPRNNHTHSAKNINTIGIIDKTIRN